MRRGRPSEDLPDPDDRHREAGTPGPRHHHHLAGGRRIDRLARDGPVSFALRTDDTGAWSAFGDVRAALRAASEAITAGADVPAVAIEARTRTGRAVEVVAGAPVAGMAIGALEDEPLRIIEGPSELPSDP